MKPIPFLLILSGIFFFSCTDDSDSEVDTQNEISVVQKEPEKVMLTSTMDHLRVRDQPDLSGETVYMLMENESAEFLEVKKDGERTTVKLRGFPYKDPWVKIKTKDETEGWVYGGGLKFESESEITDILIKSRLEALFGKEDAKGILKYKNNFNKATSSVELAETYRNAKLIRDATEDILHEKIEVTDHNKLADLSWLETAMPGYHSQLVAEGTMIHLFIDFKAFAKKARRTAGHEDDEFMELSMKIFPIDSIEHFFPGWFMQTWDYGGHSELGAGIHKNLLDEMNRILAHSPLFEEEIEDYKNQIIKDITDSHVSYWQPKDAVLRELDEIIAADFGILSEEDKIALNTRRKLFENPEANKIKVNVKSGVHDL